MTNTSSRLTPLLLLAGLLLAACGSPAPQPSPTPQPEAVLTAAAQTAAAGLTEQAKPPPSVTPTPLPTGLPLTPSITPTPTVTLPVGFTPSPGTPPPGGNDQAEYWADITIPDGTDFAPDERFTKTWRVKNTGTSTWAPEFSLGFIGGAQMSGPASVPLGKTVPPGEFADLSVDLVSPETNGTYRGFWKMRNTAGTFFDFAIYVEIDVTGGKAGPSPTPGSGGGAGDVSGVSLSVDDANPDACPHTFVFTGTITLKEAATVTYRMEAGSSTPGFTFDLPGEQSSPLPAGANPVNFTLDLSDTVDGWAQLHVTSPSDVTSNQVAFSLNCSP